MHNGNDLNTKIIRKRKMPSTYRHIGEAAPYYDDYEGSKHDDKGYVKVLWKPGRAVQARELTQMQTYSQNQIASLGGYLFKDGTVVQGGIISTTTKQKYFIGTVSYPAGNNLDDIMAGFMSNNKVSGSSTADGLYPTGIGDIKIQIVGWTTMYDSDGGLSLVSSTNSMEGRTTTKVVVFYNILGGSFNDRTIGTNLSITFQSPISDVNATLTVVNIVKTSSSEENRYLTCTCATCTKGTIFIDGYFVNCPMGYVLVNPLQCVEDADTNTSVLTVSDISEDNEEYNIGFWIDRKIVNAYDDETLTDPAGGTYNHKAPGADRYSILAKLKCFSSKQIDEMIDAGDNILLVHSTSDVTEGNGATSGIKFAGGIVMKNNIVIKEQTNVGTNSALMDEMARRTYEESGNYTVNPWKVQLEDLEYTDSSNLKTPVSDQYNVMVGPGLGYIYGYRISTCVSQVIPNIKSRTTLPKIGNSKFTEDSLNVLSEDIYTLNDVGGPDRTAKKNINSWHLENIFSGSRVYMLDKRIGDVIKTSESKDVWWSLTLGSTTNASTGVVAFTRESLSQKPYSVNVVGSCIVSDIAADGWYNLKLSVLNVEGASNLSDVSSLASFDKNGVLSGYIDLQHDGIGNTTVWKNVEAPLIFELDWPYVAPDQNTFATFVCNAFIKSTSTSTIEKNGTTYVLANFSSTAAGVSSPSTSRAINFLVDATTGTVIPSSKIAVKDDTTNKSFSIQEMNPGTLYENHEYWVSYNGNGKVAADTSSTQIRQFGTKTLTIASMTLDSNMLSYLARAHRDTTGTLQDVVDITVGATTYSEGNASVVSSNSGFVTDLIKILSIEKSEGSNQTGTKEIYWKVDEDDISPYLEVFDGCTDCRYESATIKGIGAWCVDKFGAEASDSTISSTLTITFAYWKHSDSGGFYYAGSYRTADVTVGSSTAVAMDTYKKRLAEWYGVSSIDETTLGKDENGNIKVLINANRNAYKLIPKYKSASGAWYDLANCFDFRPDWNPKAVANEENAHQIIPIPASLIEYDVSIYLPRIDSVWVDKNGTFGINVGTPSPNPIPPKEKDGALVLYNLYNKPFGKSVDDVSVEYIDNRRHTMIDITALANRLSNLEEVVSLSMAEQSAVNMQIVDDDGMNRYKCGIFTDSFSSFENCGYSDDDWKATIDTVEKCVRADFELRDWSFSPLGYYVKDNGVYKLERMQEIASGSSSGSTSTVDNYPPEVFGKETIEIDKVNASVGGTILTISPKANGTDADAIAEGRPSKYSWLYAKNDAITEATNVQSMMFIVWNGNLTLTPAIDTWTNDLGEIVTETWTDSERPPDSYRSWTTTTDGTTTQSTVKQTIPSGITYQDLDKLYGQPWRDVPKSQRVTHLPGWWEPATTLTEVATYKTTTTRQVTETTTYTGSWQANDVSTYMESQDEFMRVRKVKYSLVGMRPNQTLKATMDKVPLKLISVEQFENSNLSERDYMDSVTTSSEGSVEGYFIVPEKMPVGTKQVEFFDGEETTAAMADYTANGKTVWTNVDRNYIRIWNAEVSESVGPETTTVGKKINSTITSTATSIFHNNDPIAETFYVEEPNGITLEAIQVYFATKDPSVGVELFIVECENGVPGQTVVPFSRVFVASKDVAVTPKEAIGPNSRPTPTTFKFSVPLQLQGLTEYAFIVIAASYNYEIYTSTLGQVDIVTGIGVREQPYVGSMFKSQNLKTWTAEPYSDVTFKMYKYQFETGMKTYAHFALDDLVSINTGLSTSLPKTESSGQASNAFMANAMTLSIGTYIPTATSIDFEWYTGENYIEGSGHPFINKQDIFFDEVDGYSLNNDMMDASNSTKFTNSQSSLKIRACLSTNDPNIAPQIDLEDFHGIFTRNLVDRGEPVATIDGKEYYDAGTYLSNTIALKDSAIGMKVAIDAMLPNNSKIMAYIKTTGSSAQTPKIMWTPSLSTLDAVYARQVSNETLKMRELPGVQTSSWQELCNKRSYLWYYVYDTGDSKKKFILPNEEAYYGSSIEGYSQSSCIFRRESINDIRLMDSNDETLDTKAAKIILKDPVNLSLIPAPSSYSVASDASESGGAKTMNLVYNSGTTSNCILLGVVAIPENGPFIPTSLPERIGQALYHGIICSAWNDNVVYNKGDVCILNGSIWMSLKDNMDVGLSPSNDALYWQRIPCALMVSDIQNEVSAESTWMELDVNEYSPSTEREHNFMEYTYTLPSTLEMNEFDSFILKLNMLSLNTKDIPRFRNLRAVAVY